MKYSIEQDTSGTLSREGSVYVHSGSSALRRNNPIDSIEHLKEFLEETKETGVVRPVFPQSGEQETSSGSSNSSTGGMVGAWAPASLVAVFLASMDVMKSLVEMSTIMTNMYKQTAEMRSTAVAGICKGIQQSAGARKQQLYWQMAQGLASGASSGAQAVLHVVKTSDIQKAQEHDNKMNNLLNKANGQTNRSGLIVGSDADIQELAAVNPIEERSKGAINQYANRMEKRSHGFFQKLKGDDLDAGIFNDRGNPVMIESARGVRRQMTVADVLNHVDPAKLGCTDRLSARKKLIDAIRKERDVAHKDYLGAQRSHQDWVQKWTLTVQAASQGVSAGFKVPEAKEVGNEAIHRQEEELSRFANSLTEKTAADQSAEANKALEMLQKFLENLGSLHRTDTEFRG